MNFAQIGPIAVYFPEHVLDNHQLRAEFPHWDLDEIEDKTGIFARHICAEDEFASDMAVRACEKLFEENNIDRSTIDFILLCTQTPDYHLPTTACVVQERLGLSYLTGALDYNLGCSGFVYGLSLAKGLICSGSARRVLLVTAENYTRYIDKEDRSLRTLFGDAATATLVDSSDVESLGPFVFSTDGSGADTLVAFGTGSRDEAHSIKPRHRRRWKSKLYMNGPALLQFATERVPILTRNLLEKANLTMEDYDYYLLHQATLKMIDEVIFAMKWSKDKVPVFLHDCGNTISSTIPVLINHLRSTGELVAGKRNLLVGFGVGLSAACCSWQETWTPQ